MVSVGETSVEKHINNSERKKLAVKNEVKKNVTTKGVKKISRTIYCCYLFQIEICESLRFWDVSKLVNIFRNLQWLKQVNQFYEGITLSVSMKPSF